MGKLDDRVALVTGGQRGLGAAILREMGAEGATLRRQLCRSAGNRNGECLCRRTKSGSRARVCCRSRRFRYRAGRNDDPQGHRKVRPLDILVNNAGVNTLRTWEDIDRESWDLTMAVNLTGVFNCCKAVLAPMKEQKKGNS